jgi:tRNA (guanine-N7-)-methyltransferase
VHIEIGSGKGTFLVNQASAYPEVGFLGIEWARRFYRYAVDRVGRRGLANVRIIRADAVTFLAEYVGDSTVDAFHVYFPDPWPKKRHHKRRFLQTSNLAVLIRCLKRGGDIQIATDHADYYEQILSAIEGFQDVFEQVTFRSPAGAERGEAAGTNYERKYIKDGRTIRTLALRKQDT